MIHTLIAIHSHRTVTLVVSSPSGVGTVYWYLMKVWSQPVTVSIIISEQSSLQQ